jgi:hypothetical protein
MSAIATDELAARALAARLMAAFAERTGLSSQRPPRRYLWTDAFAVCNFLALARGGDDAATGLADRLVEQVHRVLGRHRADDTRQGWISGLAEPEGAQRPTVGGLRIGKPLPERGPLQPFDAALEWERDGQYFHYLTRWMHALDQFAHARLRDDADRWACELAQAAVDAFGRPSGGVRLVWKMSIDLRRALVPSSGQHDALDGLVTCLQLQARRLPSAEAPDLGDTIARLVDMAMAGDWHTDDPLGLGGLLADAWRLAQVPGDVALRQPLLLRMLDAAHAGLAMYARQPTLQQPLAQRLAFRELGLAIGLQALQRMASAAAPPDVRTPALTSRVQALTRYAPLASAINSAWCDPAAQAAPTWQAHEDINAVMLATSLVPSGYLDLV